MWARFRRTRRLSDLLVLGALVTLTLEDLVFFLIPAMAGWDESSFQAIAPLITPETAVYQQLKHDVL